MNVLFIEPPYFRLLGEKRIYTPVGLLYLAAAIDRAGHNAFVYNADSDYSNDGDKILSYYDKYFDSNKIFIFSETKKIIFEEIELIITKCCPDIIGISVKSETVPIVIELFKLIKKIDIKIKIILGGPHFYVDNNPKYFLDADFIIKGEQEYNIVNIIESVFYDKKCKLNTCVVSLDELPLLDLKYLPQYHYDKISYQTKQLISTSRGCPFKCSFCYKSIFHDKARYLSGNNIFHNMEFLFEKYNIRKFYIVDDTFGVNVNQLSSLANKISISGLPLTWSCMSHASILTDEKLKIMKNGGCTGVHLGVESGSDRLLKLLGKCTDTKQIGLVASLLHKYEIKMHVFMMVGLPTETELDIDQSLRLVDKILPYEIAAQVYQPYPNTKLYDILVSNNCEIPINWPMFSRMSLHGHSFRGDEPKKVNDRIEFFLRFADNYNSNN